MAMDAAQRKEYAALLRSVPRFKDDGQTVWPEWRLAFETWMLYSGMSDFPVPGGNEQVKKMAAVSAFEGKATRALSTYGPTTQEFTNAATIGAYLDLCQDLFQPPAESKMAQLAFEQRIQGDDEPVTSYIADKRALYYIAEPRVAMRDSRYFLQNLTKGLASAYVKTKMIERAPTTTEEYERMAVQAVGQGIELHRMGTGNVTSLVGLAATTRQSKYLAGGGYGQAGVVPMEIGAIGQNTQGKGCFKCGKGGHIARECRSKAGGGAGGQRLGAGGKPPVVQRGNSGQRQDRKDTNLECFYCNKKGHIKKDCFKFKRDKEAGRGPRRRGPANPRQIRMIEDDMREMVLEEADIPSISMMEDDEWVEKQFDGVLEDYKKDWDGARGTYFAPPAANAPGRMVRRQ